MVVCRTTVAAARHRPQRTVRCRMLLQQRREKSRSKLVHLSLTMLHSQSPTPSSQLPEMKPVRDLVHAEDMASDVAAEVLALLEGAAVLALLEVAEVPAVLEVVEVLAPMEGVEALAVMEVGDITTAVVGSAASRWAAWEV